MLILVMAHQMGLFFSGILIYKKQSIRANAILGAGSSFWLNII
jgi:hypothetical protein